MDDIRETTERSVDSEGSDLVSESEYNSVDDEFPDILEDKVHSEPRHSSNPDWATPKPAQYVMERFGEDPTARRYQDIASVYGGKQALNISSDATGPRIRLLQIFPDAPDRLVRGSLISRPIFDAPDYTALSYSWASSATLREVMVNETPFPVSTHLWNALRRLRTTREVVHVWVDAICINQQNPVDKASQVQIMAQIYNAAREVAIWLGDMDASTDIDDLELFWLLSQQHRPWWRRLWVIQECAHAGACPVAMIGDLTMTLQELIRRWASVLNLCNSPDQYSLLQENLDFLRIPYEAWVAQLHDHNYRRPLVQRLRETIRHQCTDPRDKVYALLSLITESEARHITPDYRKSYERLQSEVGELVRKGPEPFDSQGDDILKSVFPPQKDLLDQIMKETQEQKVRDLLSSYSILLDVLGVALESALSRDTWEIVRLLLYSGADIGHVRDSALCAAAARGDKWVVMMLLHAGADGTHCLPGPGSVEGPFLARDTPATSGWPDAVRAVCKHVRSLSYDVDALQLASVAGHRDVVKLLLDAVADTNAPKQLDNDMYQPEIGHANAPRSLYNALYAATSVGKLEVVRLLLGAGTDVNMESGSRNVLEVAVLACNWGIVTLLLDAGAEVNVRGDGIYDSALHIASASGYEEVVRPLPSAGADVNAFGGNLHYALLAAVQGGHREVVKLLVDAGADVNVQGPIFTDAYGSRSYNALYGASSAGDQEIVKMLLDAGAHVDAHVYPDVVRLLQDAGAHMELEAVE